MKSTRRPVKGIRYNIQNTRRASQRRAPSCGVSKKAHKLLYFELCWKQPAVRRDDRVVEAVSRSKLRPRPPRQCGHPRGSPGAVVHTDASDGGTAERALQDARDWS